MHDLVQAIQELLDMSAIAALTVNSTQVITSWNEEARKLTNCLPSGAIGRPCWEILAGKDEDGQHLCRQGCRILRRAEFDGYVEPFDLLINTNDGRKRWVSVATLVVPSLLGDRVTLFHLLQDISRWKEAEQVMGQVLDAVSRFPVSSQLTPVALRQAPMPKATVDSAMNETQPKLDGLNSNHLTAREKEVLKLLIEGADTATVAEKLVISYATARNHIQHILDKMGVHSRLEAIWTATGQLHF